MGFYMNVNSWLEETNKNIKKNQPISLNWQIWGLVKPFNGTPIQVDDQHQYRYKNKTYTQIEPHTIISSSLLTTY